MTGQWSKGHIGQKHYWLSLLLSPPVQLAPWVPTLAEPWYHLESCQKPADAWAILPMPRHLLKILYNRKKLRMYKVNKKKVNRRYPINQPQQLSAHGQSHFAHQHCPTEWSAGMEIFLICAVQYGSC